MRRDSCMGANCWYARHEHCLTGESPEVQPSETSRLFHFVETVFLCPSKKGMFNLNKDNHIVMVQHPTDMRMGVNGMCGHRLQVYALG